MDTPATLAALIGTLACAACTWPPRETSVVEERPATVDVFVAGEGGRAIYRIPAIVLTRNGTLLAFAEGRVDGVADNGDIDLVVKRSADLGASWGPVEVVVDHQDDTAGNPCPVVVRAGPAAGRIVVLYNQSPAEASPAAIRAGEFPGQRTGWVVTSDDDGHSFSAPREITATTRRSDWRWLAFGPGHAIELERGPHAGRLVFPADHSTETGDESNWRGGHLVYSDDGGETVVIGAIDSPGDGVLNPNETTVVELVDGRVLANARDQGGSDPATRCVAHSSDGGASFDAPYAPEPRLVSPTVSASIVRHSASDREGESRIVFSSPSQGTQRRDLMVRSSFDEGRSWQDGPLVHPGPAAYSDLVRLPDGSLGALYEAGDESPYESIRFSRLSIDWLDASDAGHRTSVQ